MDALPPLVGVLRLDVLPDVALRGLLLASGGVKIASGGVNIADGGVKLGSSTLAIVAVCPTINLYIQHNIQ